MGKAIAGFMIGLVCLFLFSITYGAKVFSTWERRSHAGKHLETNYDPGLKNLAERESRGKKIRLSMNAFDLANGLTFQDLEDISWEPKYRFSAFLSLIASLWMVALLRKPRSHRL